MNKYIPKVLLVDDSSAIRKFYSNALSSLQYEIIEAQDPLEGLEKLRLNQIDCILSDFEMPHMNGLEFCLAVKGDKNFNQIPFIILSTHDQDEKVIQCLTAGAEDFLVKKTNPEIIISKIKLMVEISNHRKETLKQERLKTYTATITTLKHEWNNLYNIITYFMSIFPKSNLTPDDKLTFEKMEKNFKRTIDTIHSFEQVDEIEFEDYISGSESKLIKIRKS